MSKDQFNEHIRNLLIKIREEQHATQAEFAKILGISTNAFNSKENGKRGIEMFEFFQIVNHYKYEVGKDEEGKVKVYQIREL